MDLSDGNGYALNGNTFKVDDIARMNQFAGSLASTGITWAMTGSASFNVLNLRDIASWLSIDALGARDKDGNVIREKDEVGEYVAGSKPVSYASAGLFEVSVGRQGFSGRLGMGGMDLSWGTVTSALRGWSDASRVIGAKYKASLEVYSQLLAGFGLKGDNPFLSQVIGALFDERNYSANTGDYDYWKIQLDSSGALRALWDGTNDITLPDGTVIKTKNGRWTDDKKVTHEFVTMYALAEGLFGGLNVDALEEAMRAAKYTKKANGIWVDAAGKEAGDGVSLDISSIFATSAGYSSTVNTWLESGAKFTRADAGKKVYSANSGAALFWVLNRADIETYVAASVVKGKEGSFWFDFTYRELSKEAGKDGNGALGEAYERRYQSLFLAVRDFYAAGTKHFGKKVAMSQDAGPADKSLAEYYDNHLGNDFSVGAGTPLFSVWRGKVRSVDSSGADGDGKSLIIDYYFSFEGQDLYAGISSTSGHLSSISAGNGVMLAAGAQYGLSGNTGTNTTGAHEHGQLFSSINLPRNLFLKELGIDPQKLAWRNGGTVTSYTYSWYSWLRGYAKEVYWWNQAGTDPLMFPPWTTPRNHVE